VSRLDSELLSSRYKSEYRGLTSLPTHARLTELVLSALVVLAKGPYAGVI